MNLLTQEDQVTEIEQVIYVAGTCVSNELVSYFSTIFKDVTVAAGLYSEEVTTVPVVLPSSSAVEAFVKNVIKYLETRTCALSIMTANSRKIPADLIVFAGKIVPVVPSGIILEDHAVVVKDGNILDLLPREDALEKYTPVEISDLDHHILIPGLVNAHTHAAMTLLRGLSDDKPLCTWLAEDIWPAESKFVDPTFVKDGMLHAGAEMIRCGTTCFNDMYFFPEDTCEQLEEIGLRGVIGQIVFEFPTSYGKGPDDYLLKAKVMLDKYKGSELIRMSVAPHTPYTVSEMSMAKANELSKEYNVPIHIHVHETLAECHDSEILNRDSMNCHISEEKCRPLVNYKRLGFLSERLVCVHMTQLTDEEIASLAESGTHVVHCPSSNLKLASGICPITKLFAAGINVAIGTDGAASNNTLDMFSEMKLAAILAKGESMEATSIPAMVALQMATLNGAKALGLEKRIGSIEVGKVGQ
jgi:5-methylthioadenosine/S-adenosylhomocysteine deaminase